MRIKTTASRGVNAKVLFLAGIVIAGLLFYIPYRKSFQPPSAINDKPNQPHHRLPATGWVDPPQFQKNYNQDGTLKGHHKRIKIVEIMAADQSKFLTGSGYDIYQFGVYTGGGLKAWVDQTSQNGITFGNLWGFDSFQGLPSSDLDKFSPSKVNDPAWNMGGLNTADQLKSVLGDSAYDLDVLTKYITSVVGYSPAKTILVPGFYIDSLPILTKNIRQRMNPATIVDVDCDIYECTVELMEFMIWNGLIVPGTLVYYDDWTARENEGERRAHNEMTARFKIIWRRVEDYLYQVVSFGGI